MHLKIVLIFALVSMGSCGRIDAHKSEEVKTTTEANEKTHLELILEKVEPSVSEDHIKVLNMEGGTIYGNNAKGKPEMFRKLTEKLHAVNQTDFDDTETTTKLNPESTSHSHVHERTAHTKKTTHETTSTTEMSTTVHHARSKRSFTKDDLESFSEMGKVFSESFKKFNEDAEKAQKDFMSFMKKLDDLSASHDRS
jgi:hypothetical protein